MHDDQPVRYIDTITERYARLGYAPYRWYEAEDEPAWTPLAAPLGDMRLGVLTTSGAYLPGQVAFHYKDDTSLRTIPKDTPGASLHFAHITENYLVNPRQDPNCILPIDTLRTLEAEGRVGEIGPEILSCMGGIYSQRRVREELIPRVREGFEAQAVDAVLLVPM